MLLGGCFILGFSFYLGAGTNPDIVLKNVIAAKQFFNSNTQIFSNNLYLYMRIGKENSVYSFNEAFANYDKIVTFKTMDLKQIITTMRMPVNHQFIIPTNLSFDKMVNS